MWKGIFITIAAVIALFAFIFGLQSLGMVSSSFFGKWREEIRYDIHKESQTYRDGMQRNLSQLQQDYINADEAGKAAIRAAVLHQYSQTDTSEYPLYLQAFLRQMGI